MSPLYFLLVSTFLAAVSQIIVKIGLNKIGPIEIVREKIIQTIPQLITSPFVISGLLIFGIASIFWFIAMSRAPLSYAYPMLAASYVFITLFAIVIFKEPISATRLLAIGLIIVGIILLNKGS